MLGLDGGSGRRGGLPGVLAKTDRAGRAVWPSLFAYQYVAVLRRDPAFAPVGAPRATAPGATPS